MDSRGNTYQFRSVPLIQRGDWSTLSGGGAASAARDRESSHAAQTSRELPPDPDRRTRERRRSRTRDEEVPPRRRRQREDERDRASRDQDREPRRDRARDGRMREERRPRRDLSTSLRTETSHLREERMAPPRPAAPPRTHVSAYLDESTVVGVTPRSERRRAPQAGSFTLVPPASDAWPRAAGAASIASAPPASYGFDYDRGGYGRDRPARDQGVRSWEEASFAPPRASRADDRLPRRTRRPRHDGPRSDGAVARDWLYTGEDAEPRGTPGAARRREAVVGALTAVPRAAIGGLVGLLAHTRGLFVLLLAAMTAFMLYAPARELYVANRRLDTLQQTYEALLEENETIRSDLKLLQTREGIENEARARGYVEPGETKVIVEGLPEDDTPVALSYLEPIELPDRRPWYIKVLDELFNYRAEE